MKKKNKIFGFGRVKIGGKPITKVGLDSGVLVALVENDREYNLKKPIIFIQNDLCYAYQLVLNQSIGVLINKRGYSEKDAKNKILNYVRKHNISIIKEKNINLQKRDMIYHDLIKKRNKLTVVPKPEDSDVDIIASYNVEGIDCFVTTNYKHFIEYGKYLNIHIERIETEKQKDRREADKMLRDFFWKPRYKKRKKFR